MRDHIAHRMHCSFSLTLSLLLLLSLLTISSTTQQHGKKNLQPNSMEPSELETLFKIMDSMSSDQTWRVSYPNPCKPGSSWMGIECKAGNDSHLHVTRLDFGSPPSPSCKMNSIFPSLIFHLPYLQSAIFSQCSLIQKPDSPSHKTNSLTPNYSSSACALTRPWLAQSHLRCLP